MYLGSDLEFEKNIQTAYKFCCRNSYIKDKKIDKIKEILIKNGISNTVINEIEVDFAFKKFEAVEIKYNNEIVLFPIKKELEIDSIFDTFISLGCMIPCHIQRGSLKEVSNYISNSKNEDKNKLLEHFFREIYTIEFISELFIDNYKKMEFIKNYSEIILESIKAFCLGLSHIAIMSLIPVIEGIIRDINYDLTKNKTDKIDKELFLSTIKIILCNYKKSIFNNWSWVPDEFFDNKYLEKFEERVQILISFEFFIKKHLYENTDKFSGYGKLNRHGIIHGLFKGYNEEINFFKLLTTLNGLYFILLIHLNKKGSIWLKTTDDSKNLTSDLNILKNMKPMIKKM